MATTQYIGARYVPVLADPVEWSSSKTYEPLTIVTHEGNSYTSRQFVPKGIDITNEQYWALTGNYDAQVELYRRETQQAVSQINGWYDDAVAEYANKYGAKPFAFETVKDMQNARDLLYVGAICRTNGFHASGDGGAAWYTISDTGTANGMDVLACGNLFANLIVSNYITPEMLGAFGNGVTDDSAYFEYAIKNYNKISGVGKYKIAVNVNATDINKDICIENCNFVAFDNNYCLTIKTQRETNPFTNLQLKNIFANCENGFFLDISGVAAQATGQHPIVLDNICVRAGTNNGVQIYLHDLSNIQCHNISIKGLSTNNTVGTGMEITGGINNIFSNIYIDHVGTGLYLHSHDNVNTEGFSFTNIKILNCAIDLEARSIGTTALLEMTFVNCVFDISPKSVNLYNIFRVNFIGCYFGTIGVSATDTYLVTMQSLMRDCVFDDCVFLGNNVNCSAFNLLSNYNTDSRNNPKIQNCTFINCQRAFDGAGYLQKMPLFNLTFENTTPYHIGGNCIMIGCSSTEPIVHMNTELIGCINITNN